METRTAVHEPFLRTAGRTPLEPASLSAAERFRAVVLDANSPDTARIARRTAAEVLRDWGLCHLVDNVTLCVSELVGNAVHHAIPDGWQDGLGGERHLSVAFRAWPKWLFVEVCDQDSTPPMLPVGDLLTPLSSAASPEMTLPDNGRGLLIVQNLSDATWWAPRDTGGKSVFCRFDLNGGAG
ncbi:ATP-binding protein [Streptomyces sp. TRM43335]|uniref:ATP-binding protein n=1 Tax=Streptomyces taklimakanensis TaxID=2569853 RepID=A0A6G2BCV1_9ACTN|nr:ATP-binding protein [Streptomyces taklimakanensis]MTE20044.1 ATP-binding protein [Streptomyces taklimakanensis]